MVADILKLGFSTLLLIYNCFCGIVIDLVFYLLSYNLL